MKSKKLTTALKTVSMALVAIAVILSVVLQPAADTVLYKSSGITRLDNAPAVNYQDYLDSSVVHQLPDNIDGNEDISVIISVARESLMDAYNNSDKSVSFTEFAADEKNYAALESKIGEDKARILANLDKLGIKYETGEEYSALMSGFEIVIKAKDFTATSKSLGEGETAIVGEVYNVAETQLVENTVNVYETGIFDSSASGYDGSGMVIAVLDTGLDSAHTAFSVNNFTSQKLGLTYEQVAAVFGQTTAKKLNEGLGVDDVFINNKVPFGYDYADNDPDVYSTHNNHGTHVSGVIVGKDDVITGVAPNAQLVSMKIFSDVMDTARTSWILSALEDCVVLGVDVINMSLGTSCGFSRESDEEALNGVYDKIRAAGISLIVAASNSYSSAYGSEANGNLGLTSNPDTGTVGSPSTYKGTMSVASINGVETPYIKFGDTIMYFDETTNGFAEENDFFETLLGDTESKEYEFVVIPGVGRTADYTGIDVNGKIALVRRGQNTFEEKAMIAETQGAAGIIIYNNVSGDIKMNVGDATLAACSISQDDGEVLAATGGGKLTISKNQTSGPFMSDFSSWGPTPSLGIKPEITAHGGNILSAITGGSYDRLSGTSMACPNLAGAVALLRQYVVENFPEIANDNVKVNTMVNRLMMSTADIITNTNGLPYAVRKQGAGLANLISSINTDAYITTYDSEGSAMDTTKLELGHDPDKTGVYEMSFDVTNFGDKALSYNIGAYVLTEGVSDTKTNSGKTTVTEQAYELTGAKFEVVSVESGAIKGTKLTVEAGKTAKVKVKITLSDENKAYLNESFENGMYIEGFVTLKAEGGTDIDMSIPYLAFYGNWEVAPLFDRDYFETNKDELDDAIPVEDKVMPDAYATRPIGGVSEDYVSYLGSYYFLQDPNDIIISANRDYVALSNQEGTIHSLRFVWAGLLRNAEKIVITITDNTTGEVVYETVDDYVRKSYGDGGTPYPANVEIEFDTMDYNLANNTEYTVRLEGYLDYNEGGLEANKKNVFEFPLTVDFEAPTVNDVEFYYEYDKTLKKNRLYAKVAIYDNHYAMSSQLGYVFMSEDEDGNPMSELKSLEQYMTPVYSQKNSTTYVTYELTDYIYEIKNNSVNKNTFVVTTYDYALNYATYEIGLPTDYVDFYFDGLEEGITLSPNEVYSLAPIVYPDDTAWGELLEFTSSRPGVARIVNNKVVAVSSGNAIIKVTDPKTNKSITFPVKVLKEGDEGYNGNISKPVADIFKLNGYDTVKAYYVVDSKDKDIGDTGDHRLFEGNYSLSMYPSEMVLFNYTLDAYFPRDTKVEFESSNESIVKIDEYGYVTAVAEGFSSVTVKVTMDGKSTYYSQTVSVEVKDPFITTGASLTHYYGNGGLVTFPDRLSLTEIGNFAFANFEYIAKTEEELAFDDAEKSKQWYIGDSSITKVILPEGIEKIGAYAFANLTALEEIVLPSTLEAIEYGAFYGCTSLAKITFSSENNLKIINQNAFENCALEGTLDLSSVCIVSDYAFAGNKKLEGVNFSKTLLSIGQYAFAGCEKLEDVTIEAEKVKYGAYAFTGCKALESFYVNAAVLPEGMFHECENMTSVKIGPDVITIGQFAFRSTKINEFEITSGNKAYKVQKANYILSADGKELCAVAPTVTGKFTAENIGGAEVTVIEKGAFSHNIKIEEIVLPSVTVIEDYGVASAKGVTSVTFGKLTKIGEYAFFETSLTEAPAFNAETSLGKYAFSFTAITSVTIPDGITLPEGIFSECMSLESVTIGNNVTIGAHAFTVNKDSIFKVNSRDEDGEKHFYYVFESSLNSVTIGNDVTIGDNAFANAASLETVTLGSGAKIGYMAFYNNCSLKNIDLSKAVSIGDYAFSGDVYYVCLDDQMTISAISKEGTYIYTYHGPMMEKVDLTSAESIGEYSFSYCRDMTDVVLGEKITEIPQYAFAGCVSLKNINTEKIEKVGAHAFLQCEVLEKIELPAVTEIGDYAFLYCELLSDVTIGANGTTIAEGAFSYCDKLTAVKNLELATVIGDYSFAYTGITEADLSGATEIGDYAFMKETVTPFAVTLGDKLAVLGDNPFAMCELKPFSKSEITTVNGKDYENVVYSYTITDTVSVIDGSLYCKVPNGLELITFAGTDLIDAKVADGTVRITGMAFAGSKVSMVKLPYTAVSIGHKAFYACDELQTVVFTSYHSPILEEEYDPTYYESLEHIPGSGDFGDYTDYDGTSVKIEGMGLIPYFMWNATGGLYSNVFYGANFVDYVGYVEDKLLMVRPSNGQNYDSYILNQYFDLVIDGAEAADDITLAAIAAINAIPERVAYEDKALVEAARAAYNKIATIEQQSMVEKCGALAKLITAEQRIIALTPTAEPSEAPANDVKISTGAVIATGAAVAVLGAAAAVVSVKAVKGEKKKGSDEDECEN